MAASNYYGFAAGAVAGPQYSAQPTPAYTHPPTVASYTVQQTPGVDHTVAPAYAPAVQAARPMASAAYGGYQAHAAQDYGYGARQPEPTPQPATAQNYQDGYSYGRSPSASSYETKPYYPVVVTQSQHPATDSYYHSNSQSTYSQPTAVYGQSQPQRQVTPIKPAQTVNAPSSAYSTYPTVTTGQQNASVSSIQSYTPSSSSYTSSSYNSSPVSYSGSNYSAYDAAAGYTAANASYYQPAQQPLVQPLQQQQQPPPQQQQPPPTQPPKPMQGSLWSGGGGSSAPSSGGYIKKPPFPPKLLKPKGPPKQPQLHYCEICKISCAGPQTYREHLEGQKHKKKEVALKTGNQAGGGPRGVQTQLYCELCDVSCTGADAYAAHIRGAKHQKVVKLHTKLGKPIPSIEPVVVNSSSGPANGSASKQTLHATAPSKQAPGITNSTLGSSKATPAKKPAAATKLTFTGGSKLQGTSAKPDEAAKGVPPKVGLPVEQLPLDGDGPGELLDVHPVGYDYVEEVHNEEGKMIRFHCKLCECSFNDPNAKDMHLKGRRHRIQYKKKVNPDLPVEIKPSNRLRKLHEEKLLKKQQLRALVKRRREEEQRWHLEMRRYEEEMYWRRVEEEQLYWEEQRRRRLASDWRPPPLMGRPGVPVPPLLPIRRPDSSDDRHVMTKHSSIYPTEEELQAIQTAVSHSERALRLVSDWLTEQESGKEEGGKEPGKTEGLPRVLKGVMRVGILAKGLLLRGDRNVHLILLSARKPTLTLLQSIAQQLPEQLGKVTKDGYEVVSNVEEASIVIASSKDPKMQVMVSLTSPLVREEAPAADAEESSDPQLDPADLLDKQKCLESLAALRHAKWFQARANGLQSCVIIIRVLRDLCQRVPTWGALPDWAMELLVERALSSATGPLGPGEAIRRVLECIATGMLLSDGPGLQDPCEKEATDVLQCMSQQAREDVTASSQHALRMLAFRQIHKVLGMEPLPSPKSRPGVHGRKRRLDTDEETVGEGDGKKDKKEDEEDKA
uniref:zinc finger RNA-binding protein-like n=1 Tax=Euleptes europaea TaxID=460621 RepID=UPI00254185C4|nr:zinc finger RNA-binding protein-like [Euleptes europaea]